MADPPTARERELALQLADALAHLGAALLRLEFLLQLALAHALATQEQKALEKAIDDPEQHEHERQREHAIGQE